MSSGRPTTPQNAPPVYIDIGGERLEGWSGLQIQRQIDAGADTFSFSVPFDPTPENVRRFRPYNQTRNGICRIWIGDTLILRGYIERVQATSAAEQRQITLEGRSETGVLIDWAVGLNIEFSGTLDPQVGYKSNISAYQWQDAMFNAIAFEVAHPYTVRAVPDFGPINAEAEIGQTVYDFLAQIASANGLWAVPGTASNADGGGSILEFKLVPSTRQPVAALIEGESPLVEIATDHDVTKRFHSYRVVQETGGAEVSAEILDAAMAPAIRGRTITSLQQESTVLTQAAIWARNRAILESYTCNATATGWTHDGELWAPGDIVEVYAPGAFVLRRTSLVVSQVTYQMDETAGQQTQLSMTLPEVYANEEPRSVPWLP